jgi:hypothetical protein
MRKPKDRDFIRTREGMFFCVTGYLHPPGRYTAYLKYSPDPAGKWRGEATRYRREIPYYHVRNVAETIRYLERHYPLYVSYCAVRGFRFSMVPRECVASYYEPRARLRQILAHPRDRLEEIARGLAMAISQCVGIQLGSLGVTGSILIGLHDPQLSDVNLLVYGLRNARKVRAALRAGECAGIEGVGTGLFGRWVRELTEWFPLTREEARYNVSRRWNYGFYRERFFGIHPTRSDEEIAEHYGDHVYRSRGAARIAATATGTREALFQPAIYRVEDVRVLEVEGEAEAVGVEEIISYEGRFRDIVGPGRRVEAYGKLESVDGVPRRLVIGATQLEKGQYIKPLKPCGNLSVL